MRIDIMTLFPEMCEAFLSESIIGRARAAGHVDIRCVNIRDYAGNKHNRVDDYPYGGGTGMVMQPNPIYDCYQAVTEEGARKCHLIYMTPQGKTLTQERVRELSEMDDLVFLCGHYEGVDERVIEEIVDEEISIGDYVLTGGELPALILADSISRMLPGVLANEDAFTEESHYGHLLEYPQYTRPAEWQGLRRPRQSGPVAARTGRDPDVRAPAGHAGSRRGRRRTDEGRTGDPRRSSVRLTGEGYIAKGRKPTFCVVR